MPAYMVKMATKDDHFIVTSLSDAVDIAIRMASRALPELAVPKKETVMGLVQGEGAAIIRTAMGAVVVMRWGGQAQ